MSARYGIADDLIERGRALIERETVDGWAWGRLALEAVPPGVPGQRDDGMLEFFAEETGWTDSGRAVETLSDYRRTAADWSEREVARWPGLTINVARRLGRREDREAVLTAAKQEHPRGRVTERAVRDLTARPPSPPPAPEPEPEPEPAPELLALEVPAQAAEADSGPQNDASSGAPRSTLPKDAAEVVDAGASASSARAGSVASRSPRRRARPCPHCWERHEAEIDARYGPTDKLLGGCVNLLGKITFRLLPRAEKGSADVGREYREGSADAWREFREALVYMVEVGEPPDLLIEFNALADWPDDLVGAYFYEERLWPDEDEGEGRQ